MSHMKLKTLFPPNSVGILKSNSTISDAMTTMTEYAISSVVMVDHNHRPIGIFTEHDALRVIADGTPTNTLLDSVMSKELFTIANSYHLHDAYILLEGVGHRHIIVVDDDGLYATVVSEGDFLRHIGLDELANTQIVESAMDKTPLIISNQEMTIKQVAKLMNEHYSDYAIITENQKPIGMVQERTIAHHFVHFPNDSEKSIASIASCELCFVSKSVTLHEATQILSKHGVHQLIVVDEQNNVVGLLKRNDVLKTIHGSYFNQLLKTIEQKSEALERLIENRKSLIEKSSFLDTIIDTIPDLVWVKDTNGVYIACNSTFERFVNSTKLDIIGKTDYDFVDKSQADVFCENDKKAIEEQVSLCNEEYLIFGDGSHKGQFETIKTPIKARGNDTIGILGIARDITDRKTREEQLREIDSELQVAQGLAHLGSFTWDIKENILRGSEGVHKIFNVPTSVEGVTFEEYFAYVYPEDVERVKTGMINGMRSGNFELTNRILVDDKIKWIYAKAEFVSDDTGNYTKARGVMQDITQQKAYEQELEKLANYDTLTGLANRVLLLSHLEKTIQRAVRKKKDSALLLFDLDNFRDVNDSFGHRIGDDLLKIVAQRIESKVRKEDFISRLGGDEFAIVLENIAKKDDAAQVAQEITRVLSEPYRLGNAIEARISASAGIVIVPQHSTNVQEVLQFADAALYKSKQEGRSCFRYYSDEMTISAQVRMKYQNELFRALQNKEFELYYQPQVHIETNRIIGAEALIRWHHPDGNMVSPTVFIPIAEDSGLIAQIGEWTLHEACKKGKEWLDKGHNVHISVNVSMQQLRHQNLPKVVDEALGNSGFKADKLTLELTESAMMKHENELATMLHALRARGINIAIDDFGTGYSSYAYLKRFPIDILKIDKSFIDDVPYAKDDTTIVKAIIAMSHALGYQILAEGVEKQEQVDFLKNNGCTYYQGYYTSKPVPASDFEKLL